jgi:hypothetical protein
MAISESLHPGFNHSIIEQACSDVGEVLALLFSGRRGAFFSPSKLQQIEAHFFKNLPVSEAWATQLPEFVCAEIERMLSLVERSDKDAAFGIFSTVLRVMPLLLIRDVFEEVDAMNKQGKWFQAFVVGATSSFKKIHFMGWQKSHDEDIPADRFDTHIRPRSAACDIGPRGKETSEAIRQLYGLTSVTDSAPAPDAGIAPAAPELASSAINNPASPIFVKYMKGFGDASQATVRSFLSRLEPRRVSGFVIELLAFMRVSLLKFSEIFKFEVFELFMSESVSAFAKAATDALTTCSSPAPLIHIESLFSGIQDSLIDHGHRFSVGDELNQHKQKLLLDSLSITARNFTRKVISSMSTDVLQIELTSLINTVFSFYNTPDVGRPGQSEADKRVHIFHLFRIMNDISDSPSSVPSRSSPAGLAKSKELICRSMAAAVVQCARGRGARSDLSDLESQLITLSVALEWLSLTTSGQVQNGPGALPITYQSLHPYPEAAHESTHDVCIPGAIALRVNFNKKSETHSELHSVTFTSGSLSKPHVYSKKTWAGVGGTSKLVIDGDSFTATFSSDGGGSKWGYSFTVTPDFPDLSSLLLLPLRVVITSLCFSTLDALLRSNDAPASCAPETPCLVVSLIEEVHRQSGIGQRFQHLIRGSHSLIRVFKDVQPSLSSLLAHAHAASRVSSALPQVRLL